MEYIHEYFIQWRKSYTMWKYVIWVDIIYPTYKIIVE